MPTPIRLEWLRRLYPGVNLLPEPAGSPPNDAPDDDHQIFVHDTLAAWDVCVDVVYTSEAYGTSLADQLGADHREVDRARDAMPISGSEIRTDVHAHRQWLDPVVYAHFVDRIVLLGAESTGKTTLTQALAAHYDTAWIAECGREVYEAHDGRLKPRHFVEISRGHRLREDEALCQPGLHRYLFCDTNALTTAAFSYLMTGTALPEVLADADACKERYARVLVCDDELPFEQDGWRANINVRAVHQRLLLYELSIRGIVYQMLTGSPEERLQQAIPYLESR